MNFEGTQFKAQRCLRELSFYSFGKTPRVLEPIPQSMPGKVSRTRDPRASDSLRQLCRLSCQSLHQPAPTVPTLQYPGRVNRAPRPTKSAIMKPLCFIPVSFLAVQPGPAGALLSPTLPSSLATSLSIPELSRHSTSSCLKLPHSFPGTPSRMGRLHYRPQHL